MAPLDRRPARRLLLAAAVTVAGALSLAAAPAAAAGTKAAPKGAVKVAVRVAKAPANARPQAKPSALADGPTCLFPIPGQECSEEERRLCDAPAAPDPVIVDCDDPANAWVLEMVGECDMPHLSGHAVAGDRERERPQHGSCLDAESCGASGSAATPLGPSLDYQPAIDRVPAQDHVPALRLPVPPEILRRHPGYPRDIEHPPKG